MTAAPSLHDVSAPSLPVVPAAPSLHDVPAAPSLHDMSAPSLHDVSAPSLPVVPVPSLHDVLITKSAVGEQVGEQV